MPKVLVVDLNKCGGCHICELICSWSHNPGVVRPILSRIRVLKKEELAISVPMFCLHCEKPVCKDACPVYAIRRSKDTGAVVINPDICIGCKACLMACPFGAITFDPEQRLMIKCDLCGGEPKCVRWCPNEAITYEEAQVGVSLRRGRVMEEHLAKALLQARKELGTTSRG